MNTISPEKKQIPMVLNDFIGCRLRDWELLPNHACDMIILFFENTENEINFNTYRRLDWEKVGID